MYILELCFPASCGVWGDPLAFYLVELWVVAVYVEGDIFCRNRLNIMNETGQVSSKRVRSMHFSCCGIGPFLEYFCNGVDLVGRVGGSHVRLDSSLGDASDNGVYVGSTLRTLLTDTLEGNADILYDSVNSLTNPSGGGWTYGVSALQKVADNVAVKVGAAIDTDTDVALTAGVRLTM